MRISDWSSDVCSSDLRRAVQGERRPFAGTRCRQLQPKERIERDRIRTLQQEVLSAGERVETSVEDPAIVLEVAAAEAGLLRQRPHAHQDVLHAVLHLADRKSTRLNSSP